MFSPGRFIRIQIVFTIGLVAALVSSWFVTSPDQLGPFGITVWFVGLFITLANTFCFLLYILRRRKPGAFGRALRQGILLSTFTTSLLALNSLHQLSLRDVVLIAVLLVLVEFYMRRSQ